MLGNRNAGGRCDQRRHGRDIDGVRAVAAGADDVDNLGQSVLDVEAAFAHRARRANDLVDVLTANGERDQYSGGLGGRDLAIHDRADQLGAFGLRKTSAG